MNDGGEVAGNRPVLGISGLPDGGIKPFRWTPTLGFIQFPTGEAHLTFTHQISMNAVTSLEL